VETIDLPGIEELAERFLNAIGYQGLVEIEFKRDPRDGQFKLLDVNTRIWGFHTLGLAAGVDFPWLQYTAAIGGPLSAHPAESAIGWLRSLTDLPTVAFDLIAGRLNVGEYLCSLRRTKIEATFSVDDALPGLVEPIVLCWAAAESYLGATRRATVASGSPSYKLSSSSQTTVD
jgi:predicted ATP-grasp superfamily ATP-dependent carboligase